MSLMWTAIATTVVGVGTTLYSSNAQKKANQAAQNANQEAQDKQNDSAWNAWLMTKGIQPTTKLSAGEMPTAGGYSAVNTKLPLWANVSYGTTTPNGVSGIQLVKKGSPRTTGITGLAGGPVSTPVSSPTVASPAAPIGSSGFRPVTAGELFRG